MVKLIYGDSLEVMAAMPANSVDCVVTDPPYGIRFMGKSWDGADIETNHSKRKEYGRSGENAGPNGGHNSAAAEAGKYDLTPKGMLAFQEFSQAWAEQALRVIKPGGYLLSFASTRTYHRMVCGIESAGFEIRDCISWIFGSGFPKSLDVAKQLNGEAAKQWNGWGTALKPAFEPICVARKPLECGTVAENVLSFGTGGINIDGCRVSTDEINETESYLYKGDNGNSMGEASLRIRKNGGGAGHEAGRWPANLIHDGSDEVVSLFPNTKSGSLTAKQQVRGGFSGTKNCYGTAATGGTNEYGANEGSAARFFYCAKASKADRDEGLADHDLKQAGIKNSSGRGFSESDPNKEILRANNHPTVKPTSLMQWLVRLVCPPGGTVLDPFGGSGSTGKGAAKEGFNAILIEKEKEYIPISYGRILPFAPVGLVADGYVLTLDEYEMLY